MSHPEGPVSEALQEICGTSVSDKRILLVCAHPDDETIGAGTRLAQWKDVWLVHVTDGSPVNLKDARRAGVSSQADYSQLRQRELESAMSLVGVPGNRLLRLGQVDQQVSWHMADLARNLFDLIARLQPDFVIAHSYEGGHPDHDATAFAVHAALKLIPRNEAPVLLEMTSYFNRGGTMVTGEFVPNRNSSEVTILLTAEEKTLKQRMFGCFPSQQHVLEHIPIHREKFRMSPEYDFSQPPHPGTLFYEMFDWGMHGMQWRALAGGVWQNLGLPCPAPDLMTEACGRSSV